jgi:lipopolysaccharide transport system ATP-binding protein
LLEVGTGFHPELTGRENIFLNGAILGMKQEEIKRKFDDIIEFSGVSKFVDTPVKHYSSGMYVRLAFAVAAHLEPDILLVDEVLAVGDAAFQKKCIGKMNEVTKTSGRTVLFVSHNMSAIQALCKKTILLDQGKLIAYGETRDVINKYLSRVEKNIALSARQDRKGTGKVHFTGFHLESSGKRVNHLTTGEDAVFCFEFETKSKKPVQNVSFASAIMLENDTSLTLNWSKATGQDFLEIPAKGVVRCKIAQKFPLIPGIYKISGTIFVDNEVVDLIKYLGLFEVKEGNFFGNGYDERHSPLYFEQSWSVYKK